MTSRLVAVVALCVTSGVAGAAQQARDQPARKPAVGTGAVAGRILNGVTREPVPNVMVALIGGDMTFIRVAQSDATGQFAVVAVPAGKYILSASKPPFLAALHGATKPGRPGTSIVLTDGQILSGLEMMMWPGAVVTGTVTDEQGDPVSDVDVQLQKVGGSSTANLMSEAIAMIGSGSRSATDDRGMYRIYGVQPGEYLVSLTPRRPTPEGTRRLTPEDFAAAQRAMSRPASAPPAAPSASRGAAPRPAPPPAPPPAPGRGGGEVLAGVGPMGAPFTGLAPVYYPGTTDPSRAGSVTVAAGEERAGVNIRVEFVPIARVEGQVFGADGSPAANVQVLLLRSDMSLMMSAIRGMQPGRSGPDGRFALRGAGPGQYTLSARTNPGGETGPTFWASQDVTVAGQDLTGLVLQLQPAMAMTGRVFVNAKTLPPPADLSGGRVLVLPLSGSRDQLSMMAGVGMALTSGAGGGGQSKADGTFEVTGLVPGTYLVNGMIGTTDPREMLSWRVASVVIDGKEVADLPFTIKPNAAPQNVAVTFTDLQQELSGVITDAGGRPLTASTVILFATDRRYWYSDSRRVLTARPGTDGSYQFAGLLGPNAGEYYLSVVSDLEPGQQYDPAFLEALSKAGPMKLVLGPGETKTQNLKAGG